MSEENLLNPAYRVKLIQEISGSENQERLKKSDEEFQVYTGNIEPYVIETLKSRFSVETVAQMPIVSSVNTLRKITDSRASLYSKEPDRDYTELSDDQEEKVARIYKDMGADFVYLESNRLFELQKHQTHLLIEPKKGKLTMRPIKAHQVNVIPSDKDPEEGEIYIFSGYVRGITTKTQDNTNQDIADYDDAKATEDRYIVWSKSFHFTMDGNGAILSEDITNPINMVPVIEISSMKDFSYWREITNDVAKFCVDYNVALSSMAHIVDLQGFAQAFLKAPEDLMPKYIEIGPNKILKLITNPNMEGDVEFGFASPNADLAGAQAFNDSLLAQHLSSQGLDSNTVSGNATTDKYASGTERLLAQIEKFEASSETMSIFRSAESHVYNVVKAYHNKLKGTDLLDVKYTTQDLSDDSEVIVQYAEPQSVITELEKLELAERKVDLGIWDEVDAYADLNGMTRDQAEDIVGDRVLLVNKDAEIS